jgi:glycosyltransferase involved in cell wall biosynthesis
MAQYCSNADPDLLLSTDREASYVCVRRVLHIVESLNRGAVENWLLRMLRHARAKQIGLDWTFYCTVSGVGSLDGEARELGARVVHSPVPLARKWGFVRALRAELQRDHYDVLHCHHDLVSAAYLLAAAHLPIERRVVHVHNADESVPTPTRWKQRLYREPMRHICLRLADRIVGISNHTLDTFLAGRPRQPKRNCVHYYGVDPKLFEDVVADRTQFRRKCNLPDDASLLLFAGRIVPEKNPTFVVDVLASLRRRQSNVFGVFAGSGSQMDEVLVRAKALGVENEIRMLGWRSDLPEVMSCCDWFILPHPENPPEGFGLAVVEAQLAGMRLLLSSGVPDDPLLPTARFRRLSLSEGPDAWAQAAIELLREPLPSRASAIAALNASPMNMDRALNGLLSFYS